jgi:hypothetical protein
MNLRRLALIITTLSTISCPLFAQTSPAPQTVSGTAPKTQIGRVLGKLVDAQKKPVSYATVTLLRTDSSVVMVIFQKTMVLFLLLPQVQEILY